MKRTQTEYNMERVVGRKNKQSFATEFSEELNEKDHEKEKNK